MRLEAVVQIIPAVDVLDGGVVRLLGGNYDEVTRYASDPGEIAAKWVDEGASLVHVVDLAGARTGVADTSLWRTMADAGVPFQVGGGIRDASSASAALEAGARRVVVGSAAVQSSEALEAIVDEAGADNVVAAIDVRSGLARGSGWEDRGVALGVVVQRVVAAGIPTALVTGIESDGALSGPDVDLFTQVNIMAPDLGLIASGGVGSINDIIDLADRGYAAVIVGRALYEGRFTLAAAIDAVRGT